jgi:hypothetical protein
MATCRCTVAGSLSEASMQAARSARETVNPCGRLRSIDRLERGGWICAGYEDTDLQLLTGFPAPHRRRRQNRRRQAHRKLSSLGNLKDTPRPFGLNEMAYPGERSSGTTQSGPAVNPYSLAASVPGLASGGASSGRGAVPWQTAAS